MEANKLDGINTLRYSDIFLAMYFNDGMSCLHRNHSHVLVICIRANWKSMNGRK